MSIHPLLGNCIGFAEIRLIPVELYNTGNKKNYHGSESVEPKTHHNVTRNLGVSFSWLNGKEAKNLKGAYAAHYSITNFPS